MKGFNKPLEKEVPGMKRAAYRSALSFNLKKLVKDFLDPKKKLGQN